MDLKNLIFPRLGLLLATAALLASAPMLSAQAAGTVPSPAPASAWKLSPKLTVRTGYDSNLAWSRGGSLPEGSAAYVSVFGEQTAQWQPAATTKLSLGYLAEATHYSRGGTEDYSRHRGSLSLAHAPHWGELKFDATTTFTAGDRDTANYAQGVPAMGAPELRQRRRNRVDECKGSLRLPLGELAFVRPAFHLRQWDFMTRNNPAVSSLYFTDRSDQTVGLDLGWQSARPRGQVFAAYRYGQQDQNRAFFTGGTTAANTYHRLAIGSDLPLARWLKADLLLGNDFRTYDEPSATGGLADGDYLVASAQLVATLSKRDTVSLRFARQQLPSCAGAGMFEDTAATLLWQHTGHGHWGALDAAKLRTDLELKAAENDFLPSLRRDQVFSLRAGLTWTPSATWRVGLDYAYTWANSVVEDRPGREFDRHQISSEISRSW